MVEVAELGLSVESPGAMSGMPVEVRAIAQVRSLTPLRMDMAGRAAAAMRASPEPTDLAAVAVAMRGAVTVS